MPTMWKAQEVSVVEHYLQEFLLQSAYDDSTQYKKRGKGLKRIIKDNALSTEEKMVKFNYWWKQGRLHGKGDIYFET